MLELSVYDGIPHLLSPVVTDPSKAVTALNGRFVKWKIVIEIYKMGVRNIGGYNERLLKQEQKVMHLTRRVQTGFDSETGKPIYEEEVLDLAPLPFIVVVIDEVADLMLVAEKKSKVRFSVWHKWRAQQAFMSLWQPSVHRWM